MKVSVILTALLLIAGWSPAHAQFYLDGLNSYNNGGIVTYYSNSGIVTASGNYTAIGNALTVHGGTTLQVDGLYMSSGNSVDSFTGDGSATWPPVPTTKTISGSVAPAFDIAKFRNGAGQAMNITNTQGINITQRLDFANGITTTVRSNTVTGAIRFADNATYTNTALGDAQHVNGYVSKAGDDAFIFPVGSGTDLRTLAISAPASAADQYSVAWMAGDPTTNGDPSDANAMHATSSFTAPIASVSTSGQWDWIPVSGSGAGLIITVAIPDLSGTGVAPADLRLVGWNGTSWVNLTGPTGNATSNTEGATLSGTMISGITAIGIGSISVVLPVIFTDFSVWQDNCRAAITWATAYEYNNAYFKVERSKDGRSFQEIARVLSKGNSMQPQEYNHADVQPLPGWNYYRITQVDIDEKNTATHIKSLNFSCNVAAIKVYPTLTSEILYVNLPLGYEQATLNIFNTLGQRMSVAGELSGNLYTFHLRSLPAGTYLVRIANGEQVQTFKIIYQP